ncbi:MAG: hypothetical protein FWC39_09140 [Bacteroidetes bacterium]|nr:hypothetical protein [Bacteroidota bacterium]
MLKNIKLLFQDFLAFFRQDYKFLPYCYALTVIALSIVFVYTTDLGWAIGKGKLPTSSGIFNNILLFVGLYFLVAVPVLIFQGKYKEISKAHFYFKGLIIVGVLAAADNFSWRDHLDLSELPGAEYNFIVKVLWRMKNLVWVLPVLIVLRLFWDKKVKGLYGLSNGNHHIKAYLSLYVVILPILIAVSFTPAFLQYYPSGRYWLFDGLFGNPAWLNTTFFEIVYMSDFIMVELIFRGALVIGMGVVIGRSAVLPMIAVYVALHFGKPALETISAIFGGYFLGTLAFQTKHIWGGVIIHMGIALAIELIRFTQYFLLGI